MSIFQFASGMPQTEDELSDALYSLVVEEISQGKIIKPLWTKALAHCDFDSTRTQAFYVRERVQRLQKNIKAIRQYVTIANQLYEAIEHRELNINNLRRMKEELQVLEKMIKENRRQSDKKEQMIRQRLYDQFSPTVKKNKLYTWLATTVFVALLIPAYIFGFLSSAELYLTLFFSFSLVVLLQPLWWQPMESRFAKELQALKNHYSIGDHAEAIKNLRNDIPRIEREIQNESEVANLKMRLMDLESKLAPLFNYDSVDN